MACNPEIYFPATRLMIVEGCGCSVGWSNFESRITNVLQPERVDLLSIADGPNAGAANLPGNSCPRRIAAKCTANPGLYRVEWRSSDRGTNTRRYSCSDSQSERFTNERSRVTTSHVDRSHCGRPSRALLSLVNRAVVKGRLALVSDIAS